MADILRKAKVAIIEDEINLVKVIKEYLEMRGYGVVEAYDGRSGLEVVRTEMPDVVILDIGLPDIDGSDVLAELKKDEGTKAIPVIVLTAKQEQFDRNLLLKLGAYEFISKPYRAHILQRQIDNVLEKRARGEL